MLKKIFKIPKKTSEFFEDFFYETFFYINGRLKTIEKEQNEKFSRLGLNRNNGNKKLTKLIKLNPIINKPMSSEHQVLFSSLSEKKDFFPKKILEIGTYDATNVFLLSKLFPKSNIVTIDLEDNDNNFNSSYGRDDKDTKLKFINERNKVLSRCKNVDFIQKDSLELIFETNLFDLIWIDGAHGYPILPIDISNSIRLISNDGIIICDDIFVSKRISPDSMYKSYAGFETLEALQKSGIIKFSLLHKRINIRDNSAPKNRKFLGIVNKIK